MHSLPLSSSHFLPARDPQDAASFLLSQKGSGHFVVTVNLEMLARARVDRDFFKLLADAPFRVCDGVGAKLFLPAGRCKKAIPRIPGIDLGNAVLALAARRGIPVFLLGGRPGVAKEATQRLLEAYPELSIVGSYHGYWQARESAPLRGLINRSGAKVVLVCLGSPRQEEWILQNRAALPKVRLFLPLGGSLDVYAGRVLRAPLLWQRAGLEWLWRITLSPDRGSRIRRLITALGALI